MVIQDDAGRWWAKSPSTDEWYYHDGNDWVRGTPPDYGPVTPDLQSAREQRDRRRQREVFGAMALVFAGVTWVVFSVVRWVLPVVFPFSPPPLYIQQGTTLLELAGTLVGLIGLHVRRAAGSHRVGTIGLLVAAAGVTYLLVLNENLLFAINNPGWMVSPSVVLSAQLARSLGFVLLGVAFLQARVVPRWGGLAFVAGGIVITIASLSAGYLPGLVDSLFLLVFGPFWLALGYALWPKRDQAALDTAELNPEKDNGNEENTNVGELDPVKGLHELRKQALHDSFVRLVSADRLALHHRATQWTVAFVSLALILGAAWRSLDLPIRVDPSIVGLIEIFFAAVILVYSLLLSAENFSVRSERMAASVLELQRLALRIQEYLTVPKDDLQQKYSEAASKYTAILDTNPTTPRVDYLMFLARYRSEFPELDVKNYEVIRGYTFYYITFAHYLAISALVVFSIWTSMCFPILCQGLYSPYYPSG